MKCRLKKLHQQGLAERVSALVISALLLYGIVAPVAGLYWGKAGVAAATVALVLCLAGTSSALIVSHFLRGPDRALHGMLVGMLLRMGIPLSIGFMFHLRDGVLARAGLIYYLLVFYPLTLTIETYLSLPSLAPPQPDSRSAQSPPLNTEQRNHG